MMKLKINLIRMKIKRFNESINKETIWSVIALDDGIPDESLCKSFKNKFNASDYFIKSINKYYGTDFEPMKDIDGSRFFTSVEENPDFEKAIEEQYDKFRDNDHEGIYFEIIETTLE